MHSETFKMEHLKMISPVEPIGEMVSKSLRIGDNTGKLIAFSLINEGQVIVVGGIYEIWPGVGEAVTIMSKQAYKYRKSMFAAVLRGLRTGIKIGQYRRVQATVKADFDAGINFVEALGFEREGLMRSWGPDGSDFLMYARLT